MNSPSRSKTLRAAFENRRRALVEQMQEVAAAMASVQKAAQRGDFLLGSRERFNKLREQYEGLSAQLKELDAKALVRLEQAGHAEGPAATA